MPDRRFHRLSPRPAPAREVEPLSQLAWVALRLQEAAIRHSGVEALTMQTAVACVETAGTLLDAVGRR